MTRHVLVVGLLAGVFCATPLFAQDLRIVERDVIQLRAVTDAMSQKLEEARRADQEKLVDMTSKIREALATQRDVNMDSLRRAYSDQTGTAASPATRGYSVVLVLGDSATPAGSMPDNIPAAARKALQDMKDFLPFKSYKLLDAGWMLGREGSTQLRGADDQMYRFSLGPAQGGQISVRLEEARDVSGKSVVPNTAADTAKLAAAAKLAEEANQAAIDSQLKLADVEKKRVTDLLANKMITEADAQRKLAELAQALAKIQSSRVEIDKQKSAKFFAFGNAGRPIVNTNFSMDPGETVVVGTSRLQGDKALILLLTSVPQGK